MRLFDRWKIPMISVLGDAKSSKSHMNHVQRILSIFNNWSFVEGDRRHNEPNALCS